MLQPKRQKYRKHFRGTMKGKAGKGNKLDFGEYGLKSITGGWMSANQIEAARKAITNYTKRQAKLWIRVFPDKSYTKKAAGSRMGQGKGEIEGYVAVIRPGRVIFELAGVDEEIAREAIKRAAAKLSLKTTFIKKD
ncbi:50S ribosomal protein L16 [Candidatus Beckwithbacteria bacterium CG10_big_fil_rev_8_21_14_0_10_34_10]|uniref:Large ribosomal subunit protein uL16 n=1 Tax=Candidatus Beckwithbacteria bacterium CG10_big_fil_rev_8_21_14_0_10_34_10 TaxID=1974495 RepID=A0A2H0W7S8_9BACT|nr:MAG: 50S ribosomal protein L16 [Candidatus Beckwithbacteria bacterium CG10_big_fil_rev_8_21_14_0_10_34_10]